MKKHLLSALLLALPVLAGAQQAGEVKMVIQGATSTLSSVTLTTGTSLTFSGENLVVNQGDTSREFILADISGISFAAAVTAAEDVNLDLESLKIDLYGGILTATAGPSTPISYQVFSVNGAKALAGTGTGTVSFDLNGLTKGVYIIKINDKVIKFNR